MVSILVFFVSIVIIFIIGYVIYTLYAPHIINVSTTTTSPTSTIPSNSVSNSIPANAVNASVSISERDFEGSQVNFSIVPSSVVVVTGNRVTFFITNQGRLDHGLNITGPVTNSSLNFTNATFNIGLGSILQPGENAIMTFSAPSPGNYIIFSPIPGQEALGMKAALIVLNAT